MHDTIKSCAPRSRCRKYTTCKACAAIRQAKFADRAEIAAKQMSIPTYYVLVPSDTTPAGIEYARRFFVRQARPVAGVWSVEHAQHSAGYHLNVIAEWSEIEGKFKGHIFREAIRTNVRAVAAYMTKAERAATKAMGFDRQTGNLGHASHWLEEAKYCAPIVAGAQLQHKTNPSHLPASAPGPERSYDTARRWLDAIWKDLDPDGRRKNLTNAE